MVSSWGRSKMEIPKTKSEWAWDIVGYTFFIGSILLLMLVWSNLPEKVPGHYNAAGEVDRWGAKGELFILPGVGLFILILMQVFERFPETHNYPARLNESNAEQFYLHSRKLINRIKNICLILFSFILYESISIALGWGSGFGIWFLPLTIIGTGIPIVHGVLQQRKIQ